MHSGSIQSRMSEWSVQFAIWPVVRVVSLTLTTIEFTVAYSYICEKLKSLRKVSRDETVETWNLLKVELFSEIVTVETNKVFALDVGYLLCHIVSSTSFIFVNLLSFGCQTTNK